MLGHKHIDSDKPDNNRNYGDNPRSPLQQEWQIRILSSEQSALISLSRIS